MPVRRKSDFPIKDKKISIPISSLDFNRVKNIINEYNLIYLDIIKKGIECVANNDIYTPSISGARDKRIMIKVTENEFNLVKNIASKKNITYLSILLIGLEYYERL